MPLPLLQKEHQGLTQSTVPNSHQQHSCISSNHHAIPEHLGNPYARETSTLGRQPGKLASSLSQPVLAPSGRCHGESLVITSPSVPPEHSLRTCGCQPHNRPCFCFTINGPNRRNPTLVESTESSYSDFTPDTRHPNWNRNHLQAEQCRSPQQSDLHHLSREFPAIPLVSGKGHDSHSD